MEDRSVLGKHQHDSQRNLATIMMVAKQRNLDQLSSLNAQLSTLKYSTGEGHAVPNHAYKVLSRS